VFVHCGVLTVGVRKKLGLPSPFDLRFGDPLALAAMASRFPAVPVIVPHFGAGMLREALMAVEQCGTIHLDTSSSNAWMKYYPGLTLAEVFRQALDIAGRDRILFGTDSSFFPPRMAAADLCGAGCRAPRTWRSEEDRHKIFGGNFDRLFPG
jgi:predicted TIM-barrel fold metal-dependent hydrolase